MQGWWWALSVATMLVLSGNPVWANDATMTRTQGNVTVIAAAGTPLEARPGLVLPPGTRIRTDARSEAEVRFADGSLLRVRPASSLAISSSRRLKRKKNAVVLFFGRLWSKVTRSTSRESSYEVATPNAVCGVRGTEFETAVGDDGSLRMRVTEGTVAVGNGESETPVSQAQEIEADEEGIDAVAAASEQPRWARWKKQKRERLRRNGSAVVAGAKTQIMQRKARLEALRQRQKDLEVQREKAEKRARVGDTAALEEIRRINATLTQLADDIADLGDQAESRFGLVDHIADLAGDPRFGMIDSRTIAAEAENLRRVKASLDALVREGTDISIEAMEKMLEDMSSGQRGTLKDEKGSTVKDLFGDDEF